MPSQDALEPLIDFIGSFAGAAADPVTLVLSFVLVVRVRNPWMLTLCAVALAAIETALAAASGSLHLALPLTLLSHVLAILGQVYVCWVAIGAVRGFREWVKSIRSGRNGEP